MLITILQKQWEIICWYWLPRIFLLHSNSLLTFCLFRLYMPFGYLCCLSVTCCLIIGVVQHIFLFINCYCSTIMDHFNCKFKEWLFIYVINTNLYSWTISCYSILKLTRNSSLGVELVLENIVQHTSHDLVSPKNNFWRVVVFAPFFLLTALLTAQTEDMKTIVFVPFLLSWHELSLIWYKLTVYKTLNLLVFSIPGID